MLRKNYHRGAQGIVCCLLACGFLACAGEDPVAGTPPGQDVADSGEEPIKYWFVDVTEESGLGAFRQINGTGWKDYIIEATGGGMAIFDYDNDGDLDVYFTNGGEFHLTDETGVPVRDALYANDGTGKFTDVTEEAKLGDANWTNGVTVVDYDADGWKDLFLTNVGPNALLKNMGDGTFRNVAKAAHVRGGRWSMGSCFFDFDRDGDLDLYVTNYIGLRKDHMLANPDYMEYEGLTVMRGPRGMPTQHDLFYINEGDGTFREASEEVGILRAAGFGFQIALIDYNQDGWMDLYVANDSVANYLWHNTGKGTFLDRALPVGLSVSNMGIEQAGMGIGVGDINGDLRDDLFVTNFSLDYSTLYQGLSNAQYRDVSQEQKVVKLTFADVAWGCGFHDFDNDGVDEIYSVNGHVYSNIEERPGGVITYAQRNYLLENTGTEFRIPPGGGGPGFEVRKVSRGAAVGDLDGDGDLDLVVCNIDDSPTVLRNDSVNDNHWIMLDLESPGLNIDAIGARVVLRAGGKAQARTQATSHGFLSSSDSRLHFGLGSAALVDSVQVTWPDTSVEYFKNLQPGQTVKLRQGAGEKLVD